MGKMTKFTTIVAIHLGDGLSLATCEELLLESKLTPFLLSFLSILVVLLTMRAMVASSSLEVEDSSFF